MNLDYNLNLDDIINLDIYKVDKYMNICNNIFR